MNLLVFSQRKITREFYLTIDAPDPIQLDPLSTENFHTPVMKKKPTKLVLASGRVIITSTPEEIIELDDSGESTPVKRKGK